MKTERWCMINNTSLENDAHIWLRTQDPKSKAGAEYDHEAPDPALQQLYVQLPPDDLLDGLELQLVFDSVLAETDYDAAILDLYEQTAAFKLDNTANVLTGDRWMWSAIYKTPESRLWENNYAEDII